MTSSVLLPLKTVAAAELAVLVASAVLILQIWAIFSVIFLATYLAADAAEEREAAL